jgi:DUF1365 family protein
MPQNSPGQPEPRLVIGQIWHARLRPFRHDFRYSAFYVQIPLRTLGRSASAIRDAASRGRSGGWGWGINRPALLSIHDQDHGDGRPLLNWAEDVLQRSGIEDADGEIWLQTFPRMLGYVFKPVSFWFCERRDGSLRAVIAEVNNTFGDRHVYVLQQAGGAIVNGVTLHADKAFYVSPFFEVRGRYRFRFFKTPTPNMTPGVTPQTPFSGRDLARIEYADDSGDLLLTSMSGNSRALTHPQALLAWMRYPLFSLGVILRIHWQAFRLWLKGARLVDRHKPQQPSTPSSPSSHPT